MRLIGFLLGLIFVMNCGSISSETSGDGALSNEAAAALALSAAGDAFEASLQAAQGMTLLSSLAFDGETSGISGTAEWDGTIDSTTNLNADYEIFFLNYQVAADGVVLGGSMAVAVSESDSSCSGTWMIADLPFDNVTHDFTLNTTGTGLILQGSNCTNMNVSGSVNISGDAVGNGCTVTGTTILPVVNCL